MGKQKFDFGMIKEEIKSTPTAEQIEKANVEEIKKKLNESNSQKKRDKFEVRLIPRKSIRTNKKNKYNINDIDKLMNSILHFGLLQNLLVIYSLEEDMYILEAGHRRTEALDKLIQKYSEYDIESKDDNYLLYQRNVAEYEKGYPVKISGVLQDNISYDTDAKIIQTVPDSILDSEIRLHVTNQEIREETPAEKAKSIQRLGHLYNEKNRRLNRKERLNINKTIGEELGITDRQVADIRATEQLIPELIEEFEKNNITLKTASAYARLSPEDQQTILQIIRSGEKVSKEEITLLKKERELIVSERETLAKQLEEKVQELSNIKIDLESSQSIESDNEKNSLENQVKSLEKEIKKLKKNKPSSDKTSLSIEEALALKYDLNVREQIAKSTKGLNDLFVALHNLNTHINAIDHGKINNLDLISKKEVQLKLNDIKERLEKEISKIQ